MTTDIYWYVPHKVLYIHHQHVLEQQELALANKIVTGLLRQQPDAPISLISDVRDVKESHISMLQLNDTLSFAREPNVQTVISAQSNKAMVFMGKIFSQVMGMNYTYVTDASDIPVLLQPMYPDVTFPALDAAEMTLLETINEVQLTS
jgi:hypothetical protein